MATTNLLENWNLKRKRFYPRTWHKSVKSRTVSVVALPKERATDGTAASSTEQTGIYSTRDPRVSVSCRVDSSLAVGDQVIDIGQVFKFVLSATCLCYLSASIKIQRNRRNIQSWLCRECFRDLFNNGDDLCDNWNRLRPAVICQERERTIVTHWPCRLQQYTTITN